MDATYFSMHSICVQYSFDCWHQILHTDLSDVNAVQCAAKSETMARISGFSTGKYLLYIGNQTV